MNYVLTARFVFGQQATMRGLRRFFVASLAGLGVNVGVTIGLIAVISYPPILAKLTGIGVAFFCDF
jgi:putative flippase GtrA